MEHQCVRLWVAVAALCLGHNGWSQNQKLDCVRGEVHIDFPPAIRSAVRLASMGADRTVGLADVSGDGRFELCNLPDGDYRLTVLVDDTRPIYDEVVSVRQQSAPIVVQVPRQETVRPPGGAVPVNELLHPPARKAERAFAAARKFADAGAYGKAEEELEKAVRISPDFADAWVNLAAQHIRLRRYEQALVELSRAGEIAKPTALILGNTAIAQFGLHRNEEALRSVRQSLALDPSFPQGHWVLGTMLATDRRTLSEAIGHLEQAARTLPAAQADLERARRELALAITHP